MAARLVLKHAMHKDAAREDLTAIFKYIERDAGLEMPKTVRNSARPGQLSVAAKGRCARLSFNDGEAPPSVKQRLTTDPWSQESVHLVEQI